MSSHCNKKTVTFELLDPASFDPFLVSGSSLLYDVLIPENTLFPRGKIVCMDYGFRVNVPNNMVLSIFSRPSIAAKGLHHISTFFEGTGTIFSVIANLSESDVTLSRGARVGHLTFLAAHNVNLVPDMREEDSDTESNISISNFMDWE